MRPGRTLSTRSDTSEALPSSPEGPTVSPGGQGSGRVGILYEVYYRTSRGGIGIPYLLAKMEFLRVFQGHSPEVGREMWVRHKMRVDLPLDPGQVSAVASNLGYTEAILHLRFEPHDGQEIDPIEPGRWHAGWVREGSSRVYQSEVYVQDADALLELAPDRRGFEVRQGAGTRRAVGHRSHRALSTLDARFLVNVARPKSSDLLLDPFAGFGGLVSEIRRRGLKVVAADVDRDLLPGFRAIGANVGLVADARCLPVKANRFDLVVTEPPFRSALRRSVLDSLREVVRVLKPGGHMVVMIAESMEKDVRIWFGEMGAGVDSVGVIPRGGGLKCPVLDITIPHC